MKGDIVFADHAGSMLNGNKMERLHLNSSKKSTGSVKEEEDFPFVMELCLRGTNWAGQESESLVNNTLFIHNSKKHILS